MPTGFGRRVLVGDETVARPRVATILAADLFSESLRLRDEIEWIRLDFIWTDLDVCLTLAAIAKRRYNMGSRELAERALAAAEKGYSDLLRLFSQARDLTAEREKECQSKFNRLREQLDGLQPCVPSGSFPVIADGQIVTLQDRGWETGRRLGVSARAHPRLYPSRQIGAVCRRG